MLINSIYGTARPTIQCRNKRRGKAEMNSSCRNLANPNQKDSTAHTGDIFYSLKYFSFLSFVFLSQAFWQTVCILLLKMRGIRLLRLQLGRISFLPRAHFLYSHVKLSPLPNRAIDTTLTKPLSFAFSSASSSSNLDRQTETKVHEVSCAHQDSDGDSDSDSDCSENGNDAYGDGLRKFSLTDVALAQDVKTVVDILQGSGDQRIEMKNKVEQCGVKVSVELVLEVLSRVRNDWEAAYTFFLWAGSQPGYAHTVREYHAMIAILGKMRKFDTAWRLIDEMRRVRTGLSLVTPHTLLIMIRRYSAVHDVGRAINTFYAHKKFHFNVGIEQFQGLLSALCRYKNVQDAEHLMYCNQTVFPLNVKSFNIVLNGWCNSIGSPREAERVWKEMSKRHVHYDVVTYASMISCYSKSGHLYKVFRLYERMKGMGIEPDRKVYNAVIHALAKARLVKEALNLMKTMEEKSIAPTVVTYNSLIKPLCRARKVEEARAAFDEMLQRGLNPTIRTYHAFFRILRTGDEVFDLLEKMGKMGCKPTNDTYIMLIRKFCRCRQLDNVFKLWNEMSEHGISPDRSSYIVLIHGLFLNGNLEEAYKYYKDMKEKQLLPEPKIDAMLQTWLANKQIAEHQITEMKDNQFDSGQLGKQSGASSRSSDHGKDFLRQAESRRVVRERGVSFLE